MEKYSDNKRLIKLVWLGDGEVLFDAKTEEAVPLRDRLYEELRKEIDVKEWEEEYRLAFRRWLDVDDMAIYDLNHVVNRRMIDALIRVNERLDEEMILYWYSVQEILEEGIHRWEVCPLSGKPVMALGEEYDKKNRYMSREYPLVFPMEGIC